MWRKKTANDIPKLYEREGLIAGAFIILALSLMAGAVVLSVFVTRPDKINIEWDTINVEDGTTQVARYEGVREEIE